MLMPRLSARERSDGRRSPQSILPVRISDLNNADGNVVSSTEVKESEYVLPSYFKPSKEGPVIQTINIKNIIELGGINAKEKRKINF